MVGKVLSVAAYGSKERSDVMTDRETALQLLKSILVFVGMVAVYIAQG